MEWPRAAIVTVGTELTEGLRVDTNTRELAAALAEAGYEVAEAVTVGDDVDRLAAAIARLVADNSLVVVTGGLGPTHDDVTREAAAKALGIRLVRHADLEAALAPAAARHADAVARSQVFSQADVLDGAEIIPPVTGTAPGQVIATAGGWLALLPGPPREMRPMLPVVLAHGRVARAETRKLGVVGLPESDVQVIAQRAIGDSTGVRLTLLARPSDVQVILLDRGAGQAVLDRTASTIAHDLGEACYSTDGSSLAEVVIHTAASRSLKLAVAESCTGGMIAAALTDVPGSSAAFLGGVVAYDNRAKTGILNVSAATLERHGAVSAETVELMGLGALELFGADVAVATSGIAGPTGGTAEKPVGTVWFDAHGPAGVWEIPRRLPGDREGVRIRATMFGLDLFRRQILGLSAPL